MITAIIIVVVLALVILSIIFGFFGVLLEIIFALFSGGSGGGSSGDSSGGSGFGGGYARGGLVHLAPGQGNAARHLGGRDLGRDKADHGRPGLLPPRCPRPEPSASRIFQRQALEARAALALDAVERGA